MDLNERLCIFVTQVPLETFTAWFQDDPRRKWVVLAGSSDKDVSLLSALGSAMSPCSSLGSVCTQVRVLDSNLY